MDHPHIRFPTMWREHMNIRHVPNNWNFVQDEQLKDLLGNTFNYYVSSGYYSHQRMADEISHEQKDYEIMKASVLMRGNPFTGASNHFANNDDAPPLRPQHQYTILAFRKGELVASDTIIAFNIEAALQIAKDTWGVYDVSWIASHAPDRNECAPTPAPWFEWP